MRPVHSLNSALLRQRVREFWRPGIREIVGPKEKVNFLLFLWQEVTWKLGKKKKIIEARFLTSQVAGRLSQYLPWLLHFTGMTSMSPRKIVLSCNLGRDSKRIYTSKGQEKKWQWSRHNKFSKVNALRKGERETSVVRLSGYLKDWSGK